MERRSAVRFAVTSTALLARMALWAMPFRLCIALARRAATARCAALVGLAPEALAAVLESAGAYVPYASCLPRALAACVWLGQRGERVELILGVPLDRSPGRFRSHAWVEVDGRVAYGLPNPTHTDVARIEISSPQAAGEAAARTCS